MEKITRRGLIQGSAALGVAVLTGENTMANASENAQNTAQAKAPDRGLRLDDALVKEFVIAGHGNLAKVKAMLAQQPKLINAAWDWGGGDWETALGGAAHTGHREIALYLLEQGARLDLFAAAMLGKLEIVRAALETFPDTLHVPGPHGIPLLAHAKAGGEKADPVKKYLETLPAVPS